MSCACGSPGCAQVFNDRWARREARRYVKRGVDARVRRLLDALAARVPLEGVSTLEIGAGVGTFSFELLKRGAEHACIVDASPAPVAEARRLARELGLDERVEARAAVFAGEAEAGAAGGYDVVVLDRVVCCFPDWSELLSPAARLARRALALSYPRARWWSRWFERGVNAFMRLLRRSFRFHVHPPEAMQAALRERGLVPLIVGRTSFWELVVATRP